jgi:DNA-binding NarL/FixJ family response regulator
MMWGTMRRCTYRPLEHSVLVTSCPMVLHEHQRDDAAEIVRAKSDDLGVLGSLTEREMEVMSLIGEGLSTSDIAKRLHRSEKTVEWHRASLGHKLGVTNRVELARIALRAGLCSLPDGTPEVRMEEIGDRAK